MAGYRQIHTKIWSDNWFLDLDPQEKLLFIYLFGNDKTSVSGFYEFSIKFASFETGLDQGFINDTLAVFEAAGKVIVDGAYVWVKNLRKYNESKSPNVRKRILSDLEDLPDGVIKARYQSEYGSQDNGKTLTDPLPTPAKPLLEHEHEHEKEHDDIDYFGSLGKAFTNASKVTMYNNAQWAKAITELMKMKATPDDVESAVRILQNNPEYKVSGPWSIIKTTANVISDKNKKPIKLASADGHKPIVIGKL